MICMYIYTHAYKCAVHMYTTSSHIVTMCSSNANHGFKFKGITSKVHTKTNMITLCIAPLDVLQLIDK